MDRPTHASHSAPTDRAAPLRIEPWPDPVIDAVGLDPRSSYVETYWLGIVGPSTTWLVRRLVAGLDALPAGYSLDPVELARSLGLGTGRSRNSPFARALNRSVQFGLAHSPADGVLAVRRRLPPLSRPQQLRLPESLQASHKRWQQEQLRPPTLGHQRVQQLALTLVELGEELGEVEAQLRRWRFPSGMAQEAAGWAWERHRLALAAVTGRPPPDLTMQAANTPRGPAMEL